MAEITVQCTGTIYGDTRWQPGIYYVFERCGHPELVRLVSRELKRSTPVNHVTSWWGPWIEERRPEWQHI